MKKTYLTNSLFVLIIILPILDMSSFIFRNFFGTSFSPSTFIRPIIPLVLITIIFFKNKFKLKLFLITIIYAIYCILHLYIFSTLHYGISYGPLSHELQYLINYSFAIINLFIFLFIFYKNDNYKKINIAVLIANGIYILSIYISIFTKTSSTTYLEGQGYKGWFESGNSISSILVLNLFIIFTLLKKDQKKYIKVLATIEIILSAIFLAFLLGTRTGLFGIFIVCILYIASRIFEFIKNKIINHSFNLKHKLILILSIVICILLSLLLIIKGSSYLARRKYLESLNDDIIDIRTGNPAHVTGDILKFKEQIENNQIDDSFASESVRKSIIELYNTANKYSLNSTNRRLQQLIYNFYLVKNQSNVIAILFGNGFLNNYGELILEMEIPAFLFNFGIFGFTLFFIPFLALFIYYMYIGIKNIKKIDAEFVFLLSAILLTFVLSFLVGQLLFNSSLMIIMASINALLLNKSIELTSEEKINKLDKGLEKQKVLLNI